MFDMLLQNDEHTGRRLIPGATRRDGRDANWNTVSINHRSLSLEADDHQDGALRSDLGTPQELTGF